MTDKPRITLKFKDANETRTLDVIDAEVQVWYQSGKVIRLHVVSEE